MHLYLRVTGEEDIWGAGRVLIGWEQAGSWLAGGANLPVQRHLPQTDPAPSHVNSQTVHKNPKETLEG